MSTDILKPYTNEKLPPKAYEAHCGEVFITRPQNTIVLCCVLCKTKLDTCEDFRTHIFAHYTIEAEEELEAAAEVETVEDEAETFAEHWPASEGDDDDDDEVSEQSIPTATQKDELLEPMVDIKTLRKAPDFDVLSEDSLAESLTEHIPSPKLKQRKKYKKKQNAHDLQCETCGTRFIKKAHLVAHKVRHTGKKAYACDECTKRFYTNSELKAHKRHHSGERPFICKCCGVGFTTSGWRLKHEKGQELRESNNRPHKCKKCDKAFFEAAQLRAHAIVHTRERNHKCDLCNSEFMRRKNMLQHRKIHAQERKFVCNVCEQAFAVKTVMQVHQTKIHGVLFEKDAPLSY